jgi:hypothetical protein
MAVDRAVSNANGSSLWIKTLADGLLEIDRPKQAFMILKKLVMCCFRFN